MDKLLHSELKTKVLLDEKGHLGVEVNDYTVFMPIEEWHQVALERFQEMGKESLCLK